MGPSSSFSVRSRPSRPLRRSLAAGFTIFELLVLMLVLTAVTSIGIPAYFGRPDITLSSAAELLAKDIREVQNRAALYEEELWIRFDETGDGYSVTDRTGENLISPYGAGDYLRRYSYDAVFRGVKVEDVQTDTGSAVLIFSERGSPIGSLDVKLSYKGSEKSVHLSGRSGLITITGE